MLIMDVHYWLQQLIPLVFVGLFFIPDTGNAIHCYRCNSTYDGSCANVRNLIPFNCDQMTPKARTCKKMIRKYATGTYIIRDCTIQAELEEGEGCFVTNKGDDYCRCFTDGCNLASALIPSLVGSIVAVTIIALV